MRFRAAIVSIVLVLGGCHKPKLQPTTTPTKQTPTNELKGLMRLLGEASVRAEASLSDADAFTKAAVQVADSLKTTRDKLSPEPGFYRLADDSYQSVTRAINAASSTEERSKSWEEAQKTCQACHLRYGGPVKEVVSLVDSTIKSNP